MNPKRHWESVYESKGDTEVSWTQTDPRTSLSLIREVCTAGRVIDVGGGTSVLAGKLLAPTCPISFRATSRNAADHWKLQRPPHSINEF
jgi:hypothetical protein